MTHLLRHAMAKLATGWLKRVLQSNTRMEKYQSLTKQTAYMATGRLITNHLRAVRDEDTIAIFHVHGNRALPTPSPKDRDPDAQVPNFVRSRSELYVTVPHTASGSSPLNQYIQIQEK